MTQHYYPTKDSLGNAVEVMVGGDRPVGEVFANVFRVGPNGEVDDVPTASTVDEQLGDGMTATELQEWLARKGYGVPSSVMLNLANDIDMNRGNAITYYDESGTVTNSVAS